MNLTRSKKKDLLYVAVAAFFFLTACVLQTVDDYISDWSVKKTIALLTQYIFFGLLAYWTASVISRISDKSICSGIIVAIALKAVFLLGAPYRVSLEAKPQVQCIVEYNKNTINTE